MKKLENDYANRCARHAVKVPAVNGNDMQRPLTARGHQQAEQTGDFSQRCDSA